MRYVYPTVGNARESYITLGYLGLSSVDSSGDKSSSDGSSEAYPVKSCVCTLFHRYRFVGSREDSPLTRWLGHILNGVSSRYGIPRMHLGLTLVGHGHAMLQGEADGCSAVADSLPSPTPSRLRCNWSALTSSSLSLSAISFCDILAVRDYSVPCSLALQHGIWYASQREVTSDDTHQFMTRPGPRWTLL